MLLTISTTHSPATDLGFLLHKHPDRFQSIDLTIGKAHIFYPEATDERTTIALLLDIDPVEMVRGSKNLSNKGFSLYQYVNDRPYVASSFMSVAISKAFGSALNGHCADRPELVDVAIPLEVKIAVLPAPRGGEKLIRKMFEPLGYEVDLERHMLDEAFPDWGMSKYFTLNLRHEICLKDLLSHLYVLIPALDTEKHYFVGDSEIEKLLQKGKGWLENHPESEQITKRYLKGLGSLSRRALEQMSEDEVNHDLLNEGRIKEEKERGPNLHEIRLDMVVEKLKGAHIRSVIDLGCGEGKLIRKLLKVKQFTKITGMDVSYSELLRAKKRVHWEEAQDKLRERLQFFQGSLNYRDDRLSNYDGAAIVEVIEHMDENRLRAFELVVFEYAKPRVVVLTTPNSEYNVKYEFLEKGKFRHKDHRFEWTRSEFESWANKVADRFSYRVDFFPVGEEDEENGAPTQMGVFYYGD